MDCPDEPPIGNLIAYEYLWLSQSGDREDGEKTYPSAVIFAKRTILGKTLAYVAAISHKPPTATERAVEVPRKLKRHLGLDEDPSWIYTDQVNEFIWPGPDLQAADRLSKPPPCTGDVRDRPASGRLVRHAQERTRPEPAREARTDYPPYLTEPNEGLFLRTLRSGLTML